MLVIHAIASTFDEIKQMQGSKYVQSKLEGVFPTIKQLLNEQKKCFLLAPLVKWLVFVCI